MLFEQDGETEVARFTLPRQPKEDGECIADFLRDIDDGPERDVIGLQVVTVGQKASRHRAASGSRTTATRTTCTCTACRVEMAEAMAEYVHKRIRAELGFAGEDDRDMEKMLSQGYRGGRYSLRLPGLPEAGGPGAAAAPAGGGAGRRVRCRTNGSCIRSSPPRAIVLHHPRAKYFSV